jgi:hypothetical protein
MYPFVEPIDIHQLISLSEKKSEPGDLRTHGLIGERGWLQAFDALRIHPAEGVSQPRHLLKVNHRKLISATFLKKRDSILRPIGSSILHGGRRRRYHCVGQGCLRPRTLEFLQSRNRGFRPGCHSIPGFKHISQLLRSLV